MIFDNGEGANTKTIDWPTTVPASDINFKGALQRASAEEIEEAMKMIDGRSGVKTKMAAFRMEIRRLESRL